MTSKYVVPNGFKLHAAKQFIESVDESANTVYYLFAAKHTAFANSTIPQPYDTVKSITSDIYGDMLFGKRATKNDFCLVINRNEWASNTEYDMYDDQDTLLINKNFYVTVNAGSFYHVWKCLDNNQGNTSTVEPNFADIDASDEVYETSDRYRWKYMYSVSSSDVLKFATSEYFPLKANSEVSNNAVDGSIDIIKVESKGLGYDNYISGTFSNSDIRLNGNSLVYAVTSSASSVNTFYNDCVLYIKTGTGAGQYKTISNYVVNNTVKYVVLDSAFSTLPTNSSEYEIYPKVKITGDGTQTINAIARAIVNTSGNSIARVEMLNRGAGYRRVDAEVLAANVVGVIEESTVRAINSPYGGHGYDAERELYANKICISVKFANSESNTIPTNNAFYQVGLMKDPIFTNVVVTFTSSNGTFTGGEKVFKIEPILINTTGNVDLTTATISAVGSDFENQLNVGEYLYLKGNNEHQLAVVNSIINATHFTITTNGNFACTATYIYRPEETSYGYVSGVALGTITIANLHGIITSSDKLIGEDSGAYAVINTVSRSAKTKTFDTFVQMYHYRVQSVSGTFTVNETVYQNTITTANAVLHSIEDLGSGFYKLYVTNQIGIFNTGNTVVGANSGAIANILDKYNPEVVYNSGEVIYLENSDAITRQNNQTETFKLIFEF